MTFVSFMSSVYLHAKYDIVWSTIIVVVPLPSVRGSQPLPCRQRCVCDRQIFEIQSAAWEVFPVAQLFMFLSFGETCVFGDRMCIRNSASSIPISWDCGALISSWVVPV